MELISQEVSFNDIKINLQSTEGGQPYFEFQARIEEGYKLDRSNI